MQTGYFSENGTRKKYIDHVWVYIKLLKFICPFYSLVTYLFSYRSISTNKLFIISAHKQLLFLLQFSKFLNLSAWSTNAFQPRVLCTSRSCLNMPIFFKTHRRTINRNYTTKYISFEITQQKWQLWFTCTQPRNLNFKYNIII